MKKFLVSLGSVFGHASGFPSWNRRGGRAVKKILPKASIYRRGRGGQSAEMTTPSAPFRGTGPFLLMAQPPLLFKEGNQFSLRYRSRYLRTAALTLMLLAVYGCGRGVDQTNGRPRIALVLKTLNNPFFIDMQRGAEEAARKLGVELIVQAAEREIDVDKQMQIVENLIQSNVDAICITPSGSREIVAAISKANRAKIPVVIVDTRVDSAALKEAGGVVATFIGSDNFEGGKLAGEFVVKALGGKGKVAILEGIPGHETGDSRLKGFHEVVDKVSEIRVVASQTANWERDQGFNVFQNILQAHPDLQAVFACSDLMALGAIEAIAAAKKSGIVVVGFDAFDEAREAIRRGVMHATVAQSPSTMGALAVENALRALRGEHLPESIPVDIKLVTKENAS